VSTSLESTPRQAPRSSDIDSPYPFSVSIPQTDTERIMTNRLRSLGVEVDRSVEFLGFDAGVTTLLRPGDGGEASVRCAYLAPKEAAARSVTPAGPGWKGRSRASVSCSPT
jgi:hypothetical protein